MLSKPKYMLPGNLSQGAPVLEPDENGDYKFSFALDGDEPINGYEYEIYNLNPLDLAKENLKLSFNDFYLLDDNLEKILLIDYIKLTQIEVEVDSERNINFEANFSFPKNKKIFIKEDKFPQSNFLLPQYSGFLLLNFEITISKWGIVSFLNVKSNKFEDKESSAYNKWYTPCLNIIKDQKTNEFSELIFSGNIQLKFENSNGIVGLINEDVDELKGFFSYSYNEFYNIQKKRQPPVTINEKKYRPWARDEQDYEIFLEDGSSFFRHKNSQLKKFFYKIPTKNNQSVYYYYAYYYENKNEKFFPRIKSYPGKYSGLKLLDVNDYSYIPVSNPSAFFFEFAPYENDNYYKIDSTTVKIDFNLIGQSLFLKKRENIWEIMPKNQKGQYNFITFYIPQTFLPIGQYSWGVKLYYNDILKITSDFCFFENKNEILSFEICGLRKSVFQISPTNNEIFENNMINSFLLNYQLVIKQKSNEIFYRSPIINSNNSRISLPFKYFPDTLQIKYKFTTTNLIEQQLISGTNEDYIPENLIQENKKLNLLTKYYDKEKKLSIKNNTNKNIEKLLIFRKDEKTNKIIFIKKIKLTSNEYFIEDIGITFSSFSYFLINEDNGEWQQTEIFKNKDLDKWRLILTKGEKNDIIEENRMCHYQIDKIYDFYYNLVSGSINNNMETTINTNFTSKPSVQKGFSNYWSGSLSALMGVCNENGEFVQTIEQEKALEQLVLDQEHDKFLLDREGNIWQVEISAPLTIANQDGLIQVDKLIDLKTITINWVQIGSPTQIVFDFEE